MTAPSACAGPRLRRRVVGRVFLAFGAALIAAVPTAAAQRAASPSSLDVRDLPVVEVPSVAPGGNTLAVFLSGDGGWAQIDRVIAGRLAERGIAVVGLDARAYLGGGRTPDETAADAARLARAYMARWRRTRLVWIGYSRGADLLPFVLSRQPAELRGRSDLVAMLGLASRVNFRFRWSDVFRDTRRRDDLLVAPELAKLRGLRLLCVYGTDETDSACRDADPALVTRIARPGGHHFDRDYSALGDAILAALEP